MDAVKVLFSTIDAYINHPFGPQRLDQITYVMDQLFGNIVPGQQHPILTTFPWRPDDTQNSLYAFFDTLHTLEYRERFYLLRDHVSDWIDGISRIGSDEVPFEIKRQGEMSDIRSHYLQRLLSMDYPVNLRHGLSFFHPDVFPSFLFTCLERISSVRTMDLIYDTFLQSLDDFEDRTRAQSFWLSMFSVFTPIPQTTHMFTPTSDAKNIRLLLEYVGFPLLCNTSYLGNHPEVFHFFQQYHDTPLEQLSPMWFHPCSIAKMLEQPSLAPKSLGLDIYTSVNQVIPQMLSSEELLEHANKILAQWGDMDRLPKWSDALDIDMEVPSGLDV